MGATGTGRGYRLPSHGHGYLLHPGVEPHRQLRPLRRVSTDRHLRPTADGHRDIHADADGDAVVAPLGIRGRGNLRGGWDGGHPLQRRLPRMSSSPIPGG